jgi:hypothetical protein
MDKPLNFSNKYVWTPDSETKDSGMNGLPFKFCLFCCFFAYLDINIFCDKNDLSFSLVNSFSVNKFNLKKNWIPKVQEKPIDIKECELCKKEHDCSYGSGRFCSSECARSFSTKAKRKEINKKVSETLKSNPEFFYPSCTNCGTTFKRKYTKQSFEQENKFCSKSCSSTFINTLPQVIEGRYKRILNRSFNQSFGKTCSYSFKGEEIKCDSMLEYSCLSYLEDTFPSLEGLKRTEFFIDYYSEKKGKNRKFNPDFQFTNKGKTYIVECKSKRGLSDDFWFGYVSNSEVKEKALTKYCEENGFEMIWYTQDIPGESSRYRKILKMFGTKKA